MNKRGPWPGARRPALVHAYEGEHLLEIAVVEVGPNPNQPRKAFDPMAITELATSLKNSGMIQPVVVRRTGTATSSSPASGAGERPVRQASSGSPHWCER